MSSTPVHAALITLLNMLLLILATWLVGRARGKHGVTAPSTVGHPDFERAFRAHQNTLESTVLFLPPLWIASMYGNATVAAWLGFAWLVGRVWYLFGYISAAGSRSAGYGIGALANIGLIGFAFWALLPPLVRIG
jgi:glutathione S-transferase